jgi:hypothetical protein
VAWGRRSGRGGGGGYILYHFHCRPVVGPAVKIKSIFTAGLRTGGEIFSSSAL